MGILAKYSGRRTRSHVTRQRGDYRLFQTRGAFTLVRRPCIKKGSRLPRQIRLCGSQYAPVAIQSSSWTTSMRAIESPYSLHSSLRRYQPGMPWYAWRWTKLRPIFERDRSPCKRITQRRMDHHATVHSYSRVHLAALFEVAHSVMRLFHLGCLSLPVL